MIHIQVSELIEVSVDVQQIERAVLETLQYTAHPIAAELTLVLTDDHQLQQLNRDFLGIDAPTDVLAFPAGFTDPDSQEPYLGDVLISVNRAIEQAEANDKLLADEILLLAVHGTLHLLGFDHIEPDDKDRMWLAQQIILNRLAKA